MTARSTVCTTRFQQLAIGVSLTLVLFSTRAAQVTWTGAAAGSDRNWSDAGNWSNGVPNAGNDILFQNIDAQGDFTTNNFVDQNFTVASLSYTNVSLSGNYSSYQNTLIENGVTLTVTNGLTVGVSMDPNYPSNPFTYATIAGAGGVLNITGGTVRVGYQSSGSAAVYLYATLDMSSLGAFSYNVPTGVFGIASYPQRRQGGEVFLAKSNLITASKIWVSEGVSGSASGAGVLHFGQTNSLNAGTIIIGQDSEGDSDFQTGLSNPTVRMRAADGNSRVGTVYFGATFSASTAYGFGTNDYSAGTVDIFAGPVYIAYHAGNITGSTRVTTDRLVLGTSTSNLLDCTSLVVGYCPGGGSTTAATKCNGTVDMRGGIVNGGNVTFGSAKFAGVGIGTLNLSGGIFTATNLFLGTSITNGTGYGTLNLTGGTMRVINDITLGNTNSVITVNNAVLSIGGITGTSSNYLTALTLQQSTLQLGTIGTNAAIYGGNVDVEGSNTIVISSSANLALGQFPLIVYTNSSVQGGGGFAGLSLQLPTGVVASLVNNTTGQSVDLLVTSVPTPPVLSSITKTGISSFLLTGSGTPNYTFSIYESADLTSPMSAWTLLGTTNSSVSGVIHYTDTNATNDQRYYRFSR